MFFSQKHNHNMYVNKVVKIQNNFLELKATPNLFFKNKYNIKEHTDKLCRLCTLLTQHCAYSFIWYNQLYLYLLGFLTTLTLLRKSIFVCFKQPQGHNCEIKSKKYYDSLRCKCTGIFYTRHVSLSGSFLCTVGNIIPIPRIFPQCNPESFLRHFTKFLKKLNFSKNILNLKF